MLILKLFLFNNVSQKKLYMSVFYKSTLFLFCCYFLLSNSSGRNTGSTGAPGETSSSCNGCHSGGNFAPKLDIVLKDGAGTPIDKYEPGKTYTVEFKITPTNGNPARYGFQAVALMDESNSNAGQFSQLGERVRSFTQSGRQYLVQSQPNTNGLFEATWIAPENTASTISFYAAGLAANGNNSTGGDSPVTNKVSFPVLISSVDESQISSLAPKMIPNPVQDFAQIININSALLSIFNTTGNLVYSDKVTHSSLIDLSFLTSGIYIALIEDTNNRSTMKFMKL